MYKSPQPQASSVKDLLLELDPGLNQRTSECSKSKVCTSIGKGIILTYFTNLKDRATLEITDFEWKLVEFSYCLQVSGESSLGHIGPKTHLKSPITSRRPEEKYCLCRPFLYVAQKKKFPLRYLYVAQKKKISNCM